MCDCWSAIPYNAWLVEIDVIWHLIVEIGFIFCVIDEEYFLINVEFVQFNAMESHVLFKDNLYES